MKHFKPIINLITLLSILLTGCGSPPPPQGGARPRSADPNLPTAVPSTQPTPVNTRVLALVTPTITPTITPIPTETMGLVVDVISGDTIAVVLKGDKMSQTYLVHYIGVESPPNSSVTPWGVVAYETNRELTRLKVVRLVSDKTEVDKEGRLLRYVYVGSNFINQQILARGLAKVAPNEPNVAQQSVLIAAEALARESSLGLWGPNPTATIVRPRQTPAPGGSTPRITTTATVVATNTVTTP